MTYRGPDRELLELAAKAAGVELWHEEVFTNGLTWKVSKNGILQWNPLTDDGDALRLAVKLCLFVIVEGDQEGDQQKRTKAGHSGIGSKCEPHGADPYSATRRAIVRAAAEIGKAR